MSTVQFLFAQLTQVLSTLFEWSHSGRALALGYLCRLAIVCALLRLPTAAAAYELEKDDVVTGYGTIATGTILLMATVFILSVHDNMRAHRRSLRESVRGRLEKLSDMVLPITVLLAMPVTLVPAISDVNELTAVDPITGLWVYSRVLDLQLRRSLCYRSCLGFAIFFAALVMSGKCRRCGRSVCTCSTGSGSVQFSPTINHRG